jgi:hypothetical protein
LLSSDQQDQTPSRLIHHCVEFYQNYHNDLCNIQLPHLFNKTQSLSDDQKKTVVDLFSAFLIKDSLAKQLAYRIVWSARKEVSVAVRPVMLSLIAAVRLGWV